MLCEQCYDVWIANVSLIHCGWVRASRPLLSRLLLSISPVVPPWAALCPTQTPVQPVSSNSWSSFEGFWNCWTQWFHLFLARHLIVWNDFKEQFFWVMRLSSLFTHLIHLPTSTHTSIFSLNIRYRLTTPKFISLPQTFPLYPDWYPTAYMTYLFGCLIIISNLIYLIPNWRSFPNLLFLQSFAHKLMAKPFFAFSCQKT